MRSRIIACFIAVLALAAPLFAEEGGVSFVEGKTFAEVLRQAKDENKLVFMDCYTSWCGPCKMMATQIFPQKIMGDYFNPKFVSVKVDMEKDEGIDIKSKFNVRAFPTFLVFDGDGNELHRVVGGDRDCEAFIRRVDEVFSGNTVIALSRRYENGERGREFLASYLNALESAYDKEKSAAIAAEILKSNPADMLSDSTLFSIFIRHENGLFSDNFQYFLANRKAFGERYDRQIIDRKADMVWSSFPRTLVSRSEDGSKILDKEGLDRYKAELKKWKVEEAKRYASDADITVAQETGRWSDFTKLCSNHLKKFNVSDLTLYNWVRFLMAGSKDAKVRATAAKWLEQRLDLISKRDNKKPDPNAAISMTDGPQFKSAFERQLKELKEENSDK